ncbi:MAG: DNA replication/repair protein RecF [Firmicutes bacterium]|nr:DNA replication/repair protein RecF [Bacillota bacterium]
MRIKQLQLKNFRNYQHAAIELHPVLNIFVGNNAQGKTNLLEAMYILAMSKSYRTGRETELIYHDETAAHVHGRVERNADIDLRVIVQQDSPKKLFVNQKATTANHFVGKLNVVLFTPDSMQLIKGSPSERRRFLDIQICQTDALYRNNLLKFQRVLRQRNQLLKDAPYNAGLLNQLPIWDGQLADLADRVMQRRRAVVDQLSILAADIHKHITGGVEELSISYAPFGMDLKQWDRIGDAGSFGRYMLAQMKKERPQEVSRGYTITGPHRDDLFFSVNGQDAKTYASQGQQRTAVLSCKLAEMELIYQETGEYPVVLLDDVMSELDKSRREFLVELLNKKAQTVITTTHLGSFTQDILADAAVFRIDAGKIG